MGANDATYTMAIRGYKTHVMTILNVNGYI